MVRNRAKYLRWQRRRARRAKRRAAKLLKRAIAKNRTFERALGVAPARRSATEKILSPTLECPERLNLTDDFEKTILFLKNVRLVSSTFSGRFRVDLCTLKDITPAAALLMVAEFDRWNELLHPQKIRPIDIDDWNPTVRRKLNEMGFFELLSSKKDFQETPADEERFLPFQSGHRSEGDQAKRLRLAIESLGPKLKDRQALYDGLVEAMTNVSHHAYNKGWPVPRWWMSASVNAKSGRLTVMFLDHGMTIPRTLPHSDLWETVRGKLLQMGAALTGLALNDDAQLIKAAMLVERSRTAEEHRGNGLPRDILGYVKTHSSSGRLRIFSRFGKYTFRKYPDGKTTAEIASLPAPLQGTFIEWTIEDYAEGESDEPN